MSRITTSWFLINTCWSLLISSWSLLISSIPSAMWSTWVESWSKVFHMLLDGGCGGWVSSCSRVSAFSSFLVWASFSLEVDAQPVFLFLFSHQIESWSNVFKGRMEVVLCSMSGLARRKRDVTSRPYGKQDLFWFLYVYMWLKMSDDKLILLLERILHSV